MLLLVFGWLLNRHQSKFSYSMIAFVMIEIINKEVGDVCPKRTMCFHHLTDNTVGVAAIWVSISVAVPRPDWFLTSPHHPPHYFYTSNVSSMNMQKHFLGCLSLLTWNTSSSFHSFDMALKRLHSLCWDSPGRLTSIHPSSSASVTQGLGPFSSAATSSTSPNNRLLRRWNMTARFVKYWWLRCFFCCPQRKSCSCLFEFIICIYVSLVAVLCNCLSDFL